jgi:hypothetical protein
MILRIVDNDDHSFIASKTLDALQQGEANFQGRRFLFRSQLTAHASQAIGATGVGYRLLCGNSSDSVQTGKAVPRDSCPYISRSPTTS